MDAREFKLYVYKWAKEIGVEKKLNQFICVG